MRRLTGVLALALATLLLTPADGQQLRRVVTEAVIEAPAAEVWELLATAEGMTRWMVPHAEVDLRVGGMMRTHYDPEGTLGDEGTIGNRILSFEPERMLSIRATEPPAGFEHAEAIREVWTVTYLEPAGEGSTRVRTVMLGFPEGPAGDAAMAYFEAGNRWTLEQLARHVRGELEGLEAPGMEGAGGR